MSIPTLEPLALDRWESMGPGQGVFARDFGGFVNPKSMMLDKLKCQAAIVSWTMRMPGATRGRTADRTVFDRLRELHEYGDDLLPNLTPATPTASRA